MFKKECYGENYLVSLSCYIKPFQIFPASYLNNFIMLSIFSMKKSCKKCVDNYDEQLKPKFKNKKC